MKLPFKKVSGFAFMLLLLPLAGCKKAESPVSGKEETLPAVNARFTLLSPEQTGVEFINAFTENFDYNIYTYEYLYNGCGVSVGDVNGDGLPDLYFASAFARI